MYVYISEILVYFLISDETVLSALSRIILSFRNDNYM